MGQECCCGVLYEARHQVGAQCSMGDPGLLTVSLSRHMTSHRLLSHSRPHDGLSLTFRVFLWPVVCGVCVVCLCVV